MTGQRTLSRSTCILALLAIWAAVSLTMLYVNWGYIGPMSFRDPDDALRLVQVRDLLAGQSWFDLTQHRIFPPQGVPMHWSRLVDLPIALMLEGLTPLLGTALAERATIVIIPLAQLLLLMVLTYKLTRAMGLRASTALLSVALLGTSLSILVRFAPMRIDHHSAQVLCGAMAMLALVNTRRRDGQMGLLAGFAMACWLQISLEGLPCAVAMGGVLAMRHIVRADCWSDLRAYLIALTAGAAVLLFGTRFPSDALTPWCDSFSPAYFVPLCLATLTVLLASGPMRLNDMVSRTVPLMLGGLAGGAAFLFTGRQCLAGPFETLDPIVYDNWLSAVKEGMPIWAQSPDMQAMIVLPALLGLLGSVLGWRRALCPEHRMAWASLIAMQIVSFAISLDVMRAMSFAHLLALPGNALLIALLMKGAQRLRTMPLRVALSAGTVILTPFGATAATAAALDPAKATANAEPAEDRFRCATQEGLSGLGALKPALLFTPLDVGPHVLVFTHHSVVATGHHRNVEGMTIAISGLMADPGEAQRIVAGSGAQYLAYCEGENEVLKYAKRAPHSLIAGLLAGKHPDWLVPVPMRPGETIKVFAILPGKS